MSIRSRIRSEEYSSPNLTPLLDVVLQLITFFMMLVHFGIKIEGQSKAIRLPTAPAAMPSAEMAIDRIVVAIDRHGRLLSPRGVLEGSSADMWWAEQAKIHREGHETLGGPVDELPTLVIVRADKEASYGAVRRNLVSAQQRGFAHFTLVVLRSRGT